MSIGFVGGDLRQLTLLECFKNAGYDVKIYGYKDAQQSVDEISEIYNSDILILPMPTCSGQYIYAPMYDKKIHINDIDYSKFKKIFYAGGNEILNKMLISSGALSVDYLKNEELILKNAISTAEGALDIAISETATTIFKSKVLITGFGKVAKATAKVFSGLGANVYISARKKEAVCEAECFGYTGVDMKEVHKIKNNMDIIINTVPALVLHREFLKGLKEDALIIDLASKPGGVDFDAARDLNVRVIWALSLPGKTAPISSGQFIYDTICSILSERAVMDDDAKG